MSQADSGLIHPVKVALGEYLARFHAEFVPDTSAAREWADRGSAHALMFTPGRMIDAVEDMLASYRKNNNDGRASGSARLPIVLVAMDKGYTPTMGDYGRQVAERIPFVFPTDTLRRVFKVRVIQGEVRTQAAIVASDEPTARSIAMQLGLFLAALENRNLAARFNFAGIETAWPFQIQTPDVQMINMPGEAKNLTVLTVDVMLRVTLPLYEAPREGEPNDGLGLGAGHPTSPHGYPVVRRVDLLDQAVPILRTVELPPATP